MPHVDFYHDGKRFPSVSEVLGHRPKPWLEKWKEKWGILAVRKTAYANRIGTAFHAGAERLSRLEAVECPANRRLAKMLERIEKWLAAERFVPRHTEFHVVSFKHRYHGTLDIDCSPRKRPARRGRNGTGLEVPPDGEDPAASARRE